MDLVYKNQSLSLNNKLRILVRNLDEICYNFQRIDVNKSDLNYAFLRLIVRLNHIMLVSVADNNNCKNDDNKFKLDNLNLLFKKINNSNFISTVER